MCLQVQLQPGNTSAGDGQPLWLLPRASRADPATKGDSMELHGGFASMQFLQARPFDKLLHLKGLEQHYNNIQWLKGRQLYLKASKGALQQNSSHIDECAACSTTGSLPGVTD